jgi:hypothetical protein
MYNIPGYVHGDNFSQLKIFETNAKSEANYTTSEFTTTTPALK